MRSSSPGSRRVVDPAPRRRGADRAARRSLRAPALARVEAAVLLPRRGGRRLRRLRRLVSAALFVVAVALAVRADPGSGTTVLTAARDLAIGSTLTASDISSTQLTDPPDGALSRQAAVVGKTLTSAVRRGEVLTDARIVPDTGLAPGPGRVAVPVAPTDGSTVALLSVGMHVAVLAISKSSDETSPTATVLTPDAIVVAIPASGGGGPAGSGNTRRSVVLGVPVGAADVVAAAGSADVLTLRFT